MDAYLKDMLAKMEALSGNLAGRTQLTRMAFILYKLSIIEAVDGGPDLQMLITSRELDEVIRGTIAEINFDTFYQGKWIK